MARAHGADHAQTLASEEVKSHLGLVNTRARRYTKGTIREHVVLVRR